MGTKTKTKFSRKIVLNIVIKANSHAPHNAQIIRRTVCSVYNHEEAKFKAVCSLLVSTAHFLFLYDRQGRSFSSAAETVIKADDDRYTMRQPLRNTISFLPVLQVLIVEVYPLCFHVLNTLSATSVQSCAIH